MHIIHGTWVPPDGTTFDNPGQFVLWVEKNPSPETTTRERIHSYHIASVPEFKQFLSHEVGLPVRLLQGVELAEQPLRASLPTYKNAPLPSLEMAQLTGVYPPEKFELRTWEITGFSVQNVFLLFRELQFLADFAARGFQIGHDLKFWCQYARHLWNLILQHQFLPALIGRKVGRKKTSIAIHSKFEPAADLYERGLHEFAQAMPPICRVVDLADTAAGAKRLIKDRSPVELIRHFSEQQVDSLSSKTPFPKALLHKLKSNWLLEVIGGPLEAGQFDPASAADWRAWDSWKKRITSQDSDTAFSLGIRLHEQAANEGESDWRLDFFVSAIHDPSLRIDLKDWWKLPESQKSVYLNYFGTQFERSLLIFLGHAARMCPLLWRGMETSQPASLSLELSTAYEFLKDYAPVLESAGFKIALPKWWTDARHGTRIKARVSRSGASTEGEGSGSGILSLEALVNFDYELCVGDTPITVDEWRALVAAKSPLVQFRGEWVEVDPEKMTNLLKRWENLKPNADAVPFAELLKDIAASDYGEIEYECDKNISKILGELRSQEANSADNPQKLNGELRDYQKKGLAWMARLESLGLNPCLADDMGLGKTIQVLALLLKERERPADDIKPTLLIAPTSVLSNWKKEAQKFAPEINSAIFHGPSRSKSSDDFAEFIRGQDLIITSFSLARSDRKILDGVSWERVVVDEAQNIKNYKSAQARAISSLTAKRRVALTGTPIENRLMDMWSLFQFLNPGYLGSPTEFRKSFEIPIQRDGNHVRSNALQQMVQPFILRRLKTDKSIISDLPDKIEQKVYCNLTKEQASLYQAVVDDVGEQLREKEGIERRGLMLATLMKLKQVCNHPAQFLQDGSAFDELRSNKLIRLNQMIEEVLSEDNSLLVFSQFTEIGAQLEVMLRDKHACPVHYLHGGTSRRQRESMIENFQDANSPPSIFVLSLRAGGVGITLTRANHVFHFDRWWNPAVENQATDRAYRIGQEKTVFAHKMITLGSLEERIDEMIEAKESLAESIVGSDENWITEMDNEEFEELISLDREEIREAA